MNHESVPPTGAEADDSRREVDALADALESCARLTGVPLEAARARESAAAALRQRPGRDPESRLEQLVHAGEDCGLRVAVVRLARRDIPWQARPDCPLVVPDPEGHGWAVLARRGLFRMHLHRTGHPPLEKVGPAAARAAVGQGPGDGVVPVALVHPAMPLAPGASADAHHEHLPPLRRLLGILRPELPDIGTLLIFSFVTGILYLSVPLAVDAVVNNIAFGGQLGVYRQALFIVGVALFGVLGLLAAVRAVQHYVVEIIQRRLFMRLGADLAFRLPRVRLSALDNVHGPELVNRFFDVVTVQKSSALILLDGINLLLSTVIGLLVLAFYHPSLLAFSLAPVVRAQQPDLDFGRNDELVVGQAGGETDETVNKRAKAVIGAEMTPIICVGETLDERTSGATLKVIEGQLTGSLDGLEPNSFVLAYEPLWAIGTGKVATPAQIAEVHAFIRQFLEQRFGRSGQSVRILYGGSLNPGNSAEILPISNVDGGLIGGASLKAGDFLAIYNTAAALTV